MHYLLLLLINVTATYCLTCDEVLDMPEDKALSFQELQTMQPKEIIECLAQLGKEQLPKAETDFIWQSIVAYHEGVVNIPDKVLTLLHWITPAIAPEDYSNISLSDIDVVTNFGLNYGLSDAQLGAIADRVREDFGGKEPDDYTYYDLTALRQILCAFNKSEIEKIHPAAYREAALVIGKLQRCSSEVMSGFATLAIQEKAFGSPDTWSKSTVGILGAVAEYLTKEIGGRQNVETLSHQDSTKVT